MKLRTYCAIALGVYLGLVFNYSVRPVREPLRAFELLESVSTYAQVSAVSGSEREDDELYLTRSYVLTSGVVSAADHESQDGYFNIGKVTLAVPVDGIPVLYLRELRGRQVELVIRELKPRGR